MVQTLKQKVCRSFCISVLGSDVSGKNDLIRHFVFNKRFNALGENLHALPYFYKDGKINFSTFVELDGEEYHLQIHDDEGLMKSSQYCFEQSLREYVDCIIFVFSVINTYSYELINNLYKKHVFEKQDHWIRSKFSIVIGYQKNLRTNAEVLGSLSNTASEKLITSDMGKELACKVDAKYMECSSSDNEKIEEIYNEVVWGSLRHLENERT